MTTNYKILRSRLENERQRLINELEQLKASANPADERREGSPFGKREEEATETLELEKRLALENRIKAQLNGIEHALHKFEEKTYGLCDHCGQPIDPGPAGPYAVEMDNYGRCGVVEASSVRIGLPFLL